MQSDSFYDTVDVREIWDIMIRQNKTHMIIIEESALAKPTEGMQYSLLQNWRALPSRARRCYFGRLIIMILWGEPSVVHPAHYMDSTSTAWSKLMITFPIGNFKRGIREVI